MGSTDRRIAGAERRLAKLQLPNTARADFSAYRDNPEGFVRDVLGADSSTRRSDRGARRPRRRQVYLLSWAALWFLVTWPMSRVAIVAPEFNRHVRGVNFAER